MEEALIKAKDKEIDDLKFQKVLLENRIEGQEEEIERKINEIKNLKSQVKDLSSRLELTRRVNMEAMNRNL